MYLTRSSKRPPMLLPNGGRPHMNQKTPPAGIPFIDSAFQNRALAFKSGRELAAWIGLVPRQHSSGGKQRLGRVSKQGDRYLRRLLTLGATSVMRRLPGKTDGHSAWIRALLDRRPYRLVSLALANKMARI